MLRLIKLAVVALLSVIITAPAGARGPEWVELGDHKVGLFETDDVVQVGRGEGVFTRIRFEVTGNDVEIRSMRVRFLNGDDQLINIDRKVREGTTSPEFDLPGRRRGIQSIVMRYGMRPLLGGKPRIKFFGLRDDGPGGPPPGPPPSAGGRPSVLDTQVVDNRSDRIEFNLSRNDGMVSQIRLRATNGSVLYRAVEITFGNNQTQVIEGFDRVEPGEQGKAIDLDGERRFLRKVVFFKRPSWNPGRSTVELLGLVQPRPGPPPGGGGGRDFDMIDRQVIDRRSENVVFNIGRREGAFSKIKFKALDDSILFRKIEIEFRGGQRQVLDIIERLAPGEESPPIDLDGRVIERIIVTKRPSWRPGQARLELLGLEAGRPGWGGDRDRDRRR